MAKKTTPGPWNALGRVLLDSKYNQSEFADRLGFRPLMVSRIKQNDAQPRLDVLYKMAYILGVEPSELLRPMAEIPKGIKDQWDAEISRDEPDYRKYREEAREKAK